MIYNSEIVFKAYNLYNVHRSYNKVACILKLYRQTVTYWIKNLKNSFNFIKRKIENEYKKNINKSSIGNFCSNELVNKFILNKINNNPCISKKT